MFDELFPYGAFRFSMFLLANVVAAELWFTCVHWLCGSSSGISLENILQLERLCINYVIYYFNLPKFSKMIIFNLPKLSKMTMNFDPLSVSKVTSFRIFLSLVMEELQTSNLKSRGTSQKDFIGHFNDVITWEGLQSIGYFAGDVSEVITQPSKLEKKGEGKKLLLVCQGSMANPTTII